VSDPRRFENVKWSCLVLDDVSISYFVLYLISISAADAGITEP